MLARHVMHHCPVYKLGNADLISPTPLPDIAKIYVVQARCDHDAFAIGDSVRQKRRTRLHDGIATARIPRVCELIDHVQFKTGETDTRGNRFT